MALRITRNFAPCELVLVQPQRASMLVHPEFEQMSHGVPDARRQVVVRDTLEEALVDSTWSVGFSARVRGGRTRRDWNEIRPEVEDRVNHDEECVALVFGNEVSGLNGEETDQLQELAHIRTSREHTSLNLAVSVGVALSGLYRGQSEHQFEPGGKSLSGEGRAFLRARMIEVFAGRVALTPSAAKDITEAIERMFTRAPMEDRDARAWHLMLRALGSEMSPGDLGLKPVEKDARRKAAQARRRERGLPLDEPLDESDS